MPLSAVTALQALRDTGRVRAGQRVLVIGAAGGAGTFAVQLGKALGAHVTGVCSTTKTDLVRALGTDEVLDCTREDYADGSRRFDLVVDTAGNAPLARLRRALTRRGTLVLDGEEGGGRWFGGTDRVLRALLLSPFVGQRLCGLISAERGEDLESLKELIEAGGVTPVVDRAYRLSELPEAIRYLRESGARGKVVVTM
ncbi:NAD(P)-dependent alcohol dehydrogenase [Streptomyces marianii]|uniref:NAD(P)-dependent alcohol dehydrogenase n=1 Tax=Streptomyces marianii TaxID=1817406 RepID=UPI001F1DC504|nr:NAD(P)-dependent alcohol dehydrogenase [Streptomyces marianii]